MNWKAEAVNKLRKFDAMRQAVKNIPDELARLKIDRKSLAESGNACEDKLLNNLVLSRELAWTLEQAQLWLRTVSAAFSVLTPEEKLILSHFYIYRETGTLNRLCQQLSLEQSSIYRRRDKALHKFTLALYGTADN